MGKKELREKFKNIRNQIIDRELKSAIITDKIMGQDCYKNARVVALYSSFLNEVDTLKLIKKSLDFGKKVILPRVSNEAELKFYRVLSLEDINNINSFGIKEPIENLEFFVDKSEIDLIIVPGICFDKAKNRVGFGKGYYDKYLLDSDNIVKIGVCFGEQILEDSYIPFNEFDVKMDMVITNKEVY